MQLEDGWAYTLQTGPDFLVHRIRKLVPFGTDSLGISVYVGGHPSYFFEQRKVESQKIAGLLIGEQADWFRSLEDGSIRMESIRPTTELDDWLMFHVIINAPSQEDLRSALQIVGTMAIVEKRTQSPSSSH